MKLNKDQAYLFRVKDEEQALALINALDNTRLWDSSINGIRKNLNSCVRNHVVADNDRTICFNPHKKSIEKGLWLDTEKFIEEFGMKEEPKPTIKVGDKEYFVEDIEKALQNIHPV